MASRCRSARSLIRTVKGYDLLIAAVATLTDMPWRLTIAGDRTRNPAVAAQLDAEIEAHGLGDRVAALGAVPHERIVELYLASDVFVLASRFEGYGMALAEAIAHGLPVVSTMGRRNPRHGACGHRLAGASRRCGRTGTGAVPPTSRLPPLSSPSIDRTTYSRSSRRRA
jgi:glycosyl transferase family 1